MNQVDQKKLGHTNFPAYIRKLDKKSTWGHADDDFDGRAQAAADGVFPEVATVFSLYLVRNDDDLKRVIVGLNMCRDRRKSRIALIAFTKEEVSHAGFAIHENVTGETECDWANNLHIDISGDSNAASSLCRNAISAGREAFQIGAGDAKKFADSLEQDRCKAFAVNNCCAHCDSPP